jgi:hypothetical protein
MTSIYLVASGDLRESANLQCWPTQKAMEEKLGEVLTSLGHDLKRAHPEKPSGHGFIASQREGMDVFAGLDPDAPLIVAEAVWQYSHHVLSRRGRYVEGLCKAGRHRLEPDLPGGWRSAYGSRPWPRGGSFTRGAGAPGAGHELRMAHHECRPDRDKP